jgi:hypothetical protein
VGATYEVDAKPSDPALGFCAEGEPFEKPVLTAPRTWIFWTTPVRMRKFPLT